ncbi:MULTISPECIES: TfpX/TfpZ family type IV pilin accessory protein [unclassified Pseudomonas]|uniref:TfpX/TfpZ family type IV pilin accessory protein n=1 Tax=Pseudomonas sp. MGal98 TaxID=3162460 RepID=UPI0028A2461D|nr:TfpX/TfpZ family type IV pilin accessory protein [Pseudomonas sp.]
MRSRVKASLVHFFFSLVVVLAVLGFICFFWYPAPFDRATGVWNVLLLLALVDVTLGPLLTFVVFDTAKKNLRWDLSFIVILQLSALIYGVWTCFDGRPAWIVFDGKRFELVRALDVDQRGLDKATFKYRSPGFWGPNWVAAVEPADVDVRNHIVWESALAGIEISQRPEFYQELSSAEPALSLAMISLNNLSRFNKHEEVADILDRSTEARGWLPLKASKRSMVVLINAQGKPLAVVDLRPWDE